MLAKSAEDADVQSEEIRRSFLDEDIDLNQMVKSFVKAREEYLFAMAMRERLLESHGPA